MKTQQILWAESYLKSKGYSLLGKASVVRTMPWSEVVCLQTSEGLVFLKSMAQTFAYEAEVLGFLNTLRIEGIPTLIAANDQTFCFLMKDAGIPLRHILKQKWDGTFGCRALTLYAKLQITCISNVDALLPTGMMDYRLACLPELYRQFVLNQDLLIAEGLTLQEIKTLQELRGEFAQACSHLAAFGIPETLEHGDFHDNNILIKGEEITINDFGDAVVAHPFFSLASFLDSQQRHYNLMPFDPGYLAFQDCYLQEWELYAAKSKLIEALAVAALLRPFVWGLCFARVKACPGIENLPEYRGLLAASLRTLIKNLSAFR